MPLPFEEWLKPHTALPMSVCFGIINLHIAHVCLFWHYQFAYKFFRRGHSCPLDQFLVSLYYNRSVLTHNTHQNITEIMKLGNACPNIQYILSNDSPERVLYWNLHFLTLNTF